MTSAPIVVVTGANRGIGFEISRQLAIYPIYQNRHFLFGFVDVDNDGCAALFSSGIGFRLCTSRLRSAFHGRRMHGGRIWVESQPGQNSMFAFTLCKCQPESPTAEKQESPLRATLHLDRASIF
jgi:hypothetical protein